MRIVIIEPSARIIRERLSAQSIIEILHGAAILCHGIAHKPQAEQESYLMKIIRSGHESILEHASVTVDIVCDRSVSHQLVRHRHTAFTQESQRYVDYRSDRVGRKIDIIRPLWCENLTYEYLKACPDVSLEEGVYPRQIVIDSDGGVCWAEDESIQFLWATAVAVENYEILRSDGMRPEQARAILPNATATKLRMTANLREWRHIFKLRTDRPADPEMRRIMCPLLEEFKAYLPFFEDIPNGEATQSMAKSESSV